MSHDTRRALLTHLVAAIAFRGNVAVRGAPDNFADFKIAEDIRTPGEILAHIGDLMQGSVYLLKGEMVHLNSAPLLWHEEVARFFAAVKDLDAFLRSDAALAIPIEKLTQGPIADALTHIGQIVMLRRAFGSPVASEQYFSAEIDLSEIGKN
jgi:hypothetical protein